MIEFVRRWYNRYLSTPQAAVLILQFITIFILIYYFNSIIGPILAALILAFIFERPVAFLVNHGTSRLKACVLVMLTYIAVIIALVVTILPPAMDQLSNITKSISNTLSTPTSSLMIQASTPQTPNSEDNLVITSTANNNASNSTREDGQDSDQELNAAENTNIVDAESTEQNAENKDRPFERSEKWITSKINELTADLPDFYRNFITEQQIHETIVYIKSSLKNWLSPFLTNQIAPIIMDTFSLLLYMVIVPIFTFYMLKDKQKWLDFGTRYLAPYEEICNFWNKINKQIGQYLNGNLIHIAISAIINGLAFWLYGVNYSLILGIGVGLSVIIPYVGSIIITIPLLIISILQFGFSSDLAWLLLIYLVIQMLDAYLLTPMLFSETLDLDAFTILLAIMIFGGIWGFWGVVLAIPLATFLKTAFAMWPQNKLPTAS